MAHRFQYKEAVYDTTSVFYNKGFNKQYCFMIE